MIDIGVAGIGGRMGRAIASLVLDSRQMRLSGASESPGHRFIGRDAGECLGEGHLGIAICSDPAEAFAGCKVICDFTMPASTMRNMEYASDAHKAMVIGTTGLSDEQKGIIGKQAMTTPVVMAPNMSIGVNVMLKTAAMLTRMLGEDYDVEIVETHHRHKKDAPSGTAGALAEAIAEARGVKLDDYACYERHGIIGERPHGQIGVQSLRAGDVVGDHTIMFADKGERIELTHRAHSRENFAGGAIKAALWLAERQPGLYSMMDVLGLTDEDR